jgi:hypothetical protein
MAQIWAPKIKQTKHFVFTLQLASFFFWLQGSQPRNFPFLVFSLKKKRNKKPPKGPPKNLASAFQKCRNFAVRVRIRSNLERVNILLFGTTQTTTRGNPFHSQLAQSTLSFHFFALFVLRPKTLNMKTVVGVVGEFFSIQKSTYMMYRTSPMTITDCRIYLFAL